MGLIAIHDKHNRHHDTICFASSHFSSQRIRKRHLMQVARTSTVHGSFSIVFISHWHGGPHELKTNHTAPLSTESLATSVNENIPMVRSHPTTVFQPRSHQFGCGCGEPLLLTPSFCAHVDFPTGLSSICTLGTYRNEDSRRAGFVAPAVTTVSFCHCTKFLVSTKPACGWWFWIRTTREVHRGPRGRLFN